MTDSIIEEAFNKLNYAQKAEVKFEVAQQIRLNVIRSLQKYKVTLSKDQNAKIQCDNLISRAEEEWSIEEESNYEN